MLEIALIMTKKRLDSLLVFKKLFESREKAKSAIMAGEIFVNNQLIDKPGTLVSVSSEIKFVSSKNKYVSRGGFKLEKALDNFNFDVTGNTALDIGASTGGFTDCLLQKGAEKVFAVDVGYGQIDWKLRQDKRVILKEKTNARYLNKNDVRSFVDLITIDVSFISIEKIIPVVTQFLKSEGIIIALIKPQFEAGKDKVEKGGLITNKEVHFEVILNIVNFAERINLFAENLTFSPIKGSSGNIEYLIKLRKDKFYEKLSRNKVKEIITGAHEKL